MVAMSINLSSKVTMALCIRWLCVIINTQVSEATHMSIANKPSAGARINQTRRTRNSSTLWTDTLKQDFGQNLRRETLYKKINRRFDEYIFSFDEDAVALQGTHYLSMRGNPKQAVSIYTGSTPTPPPPFQLGPPAPGGSLLRLCTPSYRDQVYQHSLTAVWTCSPGKDLSEVPSASRPDYTGPLKKITQHLIKKIRNLTWH